MVKLLVVLDEVGELACGGISCFDAAALGQVQLDEQDRTIIATVMAITAIRWRSACCSSLRKAL